MWVEARSHFSIFHEKTQKNILNARDVLFLTWKKSRTRGAEQRKEFQAKIHFFKNKSLLT